MVKQGSSSQAELLLAGDREQNRYPLLRLEQGGIGACWISGESLCLWDREHNKYCYAVRREEELLDLYDTVRRRNGPLVSLVTDSVWSDVLTAVDGSLQVSRCVQLRAVPYVATPPTIAGVTFGPVTPEVAQWLLSVYEHPELTVGFILERAASAPAVAAFAHGSPVGLFLTHSGAELGPVYVDAAYRGSGLADALYAEMAQHLFSRGTAPVLFVLPDNHTSQRWLRRLGCVPAPKEVAWFWRD